MTATVKVDYVSDLHLEFDRSNQKMFFTEVSKSGAGDVLVLAGDILTAPLLRPHRNDSAARKFTKYLRERFIPNLTDQYNNVIYIAGNHEHYDSIYKNTLDEIETWFKYNGGSNITFMENDHLVLGDVVFVGATLWTNYMSGNPLVMQACQEGMNDYRCIGLHDVEDMNYFNRDHDRKITPDFLLSENLISTQYIDKMAKTFSDKKIVVVTHHAPSSKSLNPKHSGLLDGAYYTDLSHLILNRPNIKYWIHGHTHTSLDYMIGDCHVVSNCRGYPFETCYVNYEGLKSFSV